MSYSYRGWQLMGIGVLCILLGWVGGTTTDERIECFGTSCTATETTEVTPLFMLLPAGVILIIAAIVVVIVDSGSKENGEPKQEQTPMSERTNTCDRCGEEYELYSVFVRDNTSDITSLEWCEWDNLCKPCRMAVTDYGVYLTQSEHENLEPKKEVNDNG